jgi:hypothetical protein
VLVLREGWLHVFCIEIHEIHKFSVLSESVFWAERLTNCVSTQHSSKRSGRMGQFTATEKTDGTQQLLLAYKAAAGWAPRRVKKVRASVWVHNTRATAEEKGFRASTGGLHTLENAQNRRPQGSSGNCPLARRAPPLHRKLSRALELSSTSQPALRARSAQTPST